MQYNTLNMSKGHSSKVSNQPLAFSKANFQVLEQERNMLKITLDYVAKENENLKAQLEDMKITVKHNKELLKEYIEKITNKDKVFEKMTSQIEQLTSRLKLLEEHSKANRGKVEDQPKKPQPLKNESLLGKGEKGSNNVAREKDAIISTGNGTSPNLPSTNNTSNNIIHNKSISRGDIQLATSTSQGKKNDEKFKEFFSKQKHILDEMNSLKDDIQFLLEHKSKTKLKEKLDQSLNNSINSGRNINDSCSGLNISVISSSSTSTIKKKYNLKENFYLEGSLIYQFQDFLNAYHPLKNILFLIDNKSNVWELIKRPDLSPSLIKSNPDNVKSFYFSDPNAQRNCGDESPKSKFLNIEIKDNYENRSMHNSELDMSKMTDLNISHYMKDPLDCD